MGIVTWYWPAGCLSPSGPGPVVPVVVSQAGVESRTYTALLDTGANKTFIAPSVAAHMGLRADPVPGTNEETGDAPQPIYRVEIGLSGTLREFSVEAIEYDRLDRPQVGHKLLIGRDILRLGVLTIDGPRGLGIFVAD